MVQRPESGVKPTLKPSDPLEEFDPHFDLWGGVAKGFNCRSKEVLLSGPAGTGKTLANLLRIYWTCRRYPGARCLIVRKTRESLTETVLPDWEDVICGQGSPVLVGSRGAQLQRNTRQNYRFPNGAIVVLGGMDKPNKILSSKWDVIYVPEAIELEKKDWQTLKGRCRNYRVPNQQIIADTNPTTPEHWLKKRTEGLRPLCQLIETTHRDNPRYWDRVKQEWTPEGEDYVRDTLEGLTGHERERFLEGRWVAAEGLVYKGFDADIHILPESWIPPRAWERVWAIDWGKTAPTVLQMWAIDPNNGAAYLYRESFKTNTRPDLLGRWVREQLEIGEKRPLAVVCDHQDEPRRDFERESGLSLLLADKTDREKGIQSTAARFEHTEERPARIFFHPKALCHKPDKFLEEEGAPSTTIAELLSYTWDTDWVKDEPIDYNDHGMDAMRYMARYVDTRMSFGPRPQFNYRPEDRRSWRPKG